MELSRRSAMAWAVTLPLVLSLGGCTAIPVEPGTALPVATVRFDRPEKKKPRNGSVEYFVKKSSVTRAISQSAYGEFIVSTPPGDRAYYVLLRRVKSDADGTSGTRYLAIFARAGSIVRTKVPFGHYILYSASGTHWYGSKYLFGPSTTYMKAEQVFRFYSDGNELKGNRVDLSEQVGGNLPTSTAGSGDFG